MEYVDTLGNNNPFLADGVFLLGAFPLDRVFLRISTYFFKVFSPVGVRLPNPYENVRLCLEFAIYQTHVVLKICMMRS